MRYESKHHEAKVSAQASRNRINVCYSMAIRTQLQLNYRFSVGQDIEFLHKSRTQTITIDEILKNSHVSVVLPSNIVNPIEEIE